jgi:serine/threonine-protein kinase
MTLGSPLYMSPEQVRSSKTVDARTDVWALGVIAYELLAGVQPFEAETVTGLCAKIVADEPPSLRSIRPDVPAAFEVVVLRCLEKNPASRYQSVAELASALRPFASAEARASVTRIARIAGTLKPTLASAVDRISRPDARSSTPRPSGTVGYAETVASWQGADRRGKQVKTAGAATAGLLVLAGLATALARWPRAATSFPTPAAAMSAATVLELPPPASSAAPTARVEAVPSTPPEEAEPAEMPPPASASSPVRGEPHALPELPMRDGTLTNPPSAKVVGAPARRPAPPLKAAPGVVTAGARTTEELLQDRK